MLSALGRYEEALPHHRRAIELDPRVAVYHFNMTWLAFVPRFNLETLGHHRALLQLAGRSTWFRTNLAINLAALGRFDEALEVALSSELEEAALTDAFAVAVPDLVPSLVTVLTDMEAGRQTSAGSAALRALGPIFAMPSIWVLYGDLEGAAQAALNTAWQLPYMWAGFLTGVPELRGYPAFEEARRRRGLPD